MPPPTSKQDLKRFMSMIAYLGKFIVNLSETTAPLRKLLENDIEWSLYKPQQDAFNTLKDLVTKAPVLKYFGFRSYTGTMSRWNLASSRLCLMVTQVSRVKLLPTRERNTVNIIRMRTISWVSVWSQVLCKWSMTINQFAPHSVSH